VTRRPRVALVDHSYHRITGSSRFFRDVLTGACDVVDVDLEQWRGGTQLTAAVVDALEVDVAVFFQVLPPLRDLLRLRTPAVWVPMYDTAARRSGAFWRVLAAGGLRVVSFSRALSRRARSHGADVWDFTYYPDPSRFRAAAPQGAAGPRVLLWDRGEVDFGTLRALLDDQPVEHIIVRTHADPGLHSTPPSTEDRERYNVRLVEGELGRERHLDLLSDCTVFLAPRALEGIGHTNLEAMATGLAVVAPDRPTMNEYITHGHSGLLYDVLRPAPVDLHDATAIGARARAATATGRRRWQDSHPRLLEAVLSAAPVRSPGGVCIAAAETLSTLETAKDRARGRRGLPRPAACAFWRTEPRPSPGTRPVPTCEFTASGVGSRQSRGGL
jgi:hypothetical protein